MAKRLKQTMLTKLLYAYETTVCLQIIYKDMPKFPVFVKNQIFWRMYVNSFHDCSKNYPIIVLVRAIGLEKQKNHLVYV